ncbi:DUF5064 family protein [Pseudomonas xionganensis]|uniref:DUF5064 family protein n=1 Tax=Pseudomonas xionganensis TaxID=2654845 RepID=A0A6I4KWQ0_9PSED|nr:DUF5064 family protein [Pseudomonas xionganensis]MVW74956.1 DUF5064 family protein [Pseudomonas xionganensis]
MFVPGHLHRERLLASEGISAYCVDVYYEVRHDPDQGAMMHFRMCGHVAGREFTESFAMHRDTAYNFASLLGKIAQRQGLPAGHGPIMAHHDEYDAMFADIRQQLAVKPGEAVNLDHLEQDRL